MHRRKFLTGVSTATVLGLAGCGGNGGEESPTDGGESPGEDGGSPDTIEMRTEGSDYLFDPIGLFVESGTTLTWANVSGAHSTTAYAEGNGPAEVTRIPADAEPWNSERLDSQGATFEHTFDVEGTYDYFCIPHKALGMVGRLVVGEPGEVDGDTPDGPVPSPQQIVDEGAIGWEEFSG